MFGRSKYCAICGTKIDKGVDYERFGKHFCSQGHADQYVQEMQNSRQSVAAATNTSENNSSGGCC